MDTTELALSQHQGGRDEQRELAKSSPTALATAEIQASIMVALRFPRDEQEAYARLMKSCERPSFQEKAIYRYPRGKTEVKGPSVNMAREFARVWKNIRYGFFVVSESEETCHVRGFAWDQESNTKIEQDASFGLKVQRKRDGVTKWVTPDERDKRELVNKHGAICERNCLLKILPRDMVEDAMEAIETNQRKGVNDDLEKNRKKVIQAFAQINVKPAEVERYLGNPLAEATADQIVELRQIWTSIKENNSRWSDYMGKPEVPAKDLSEVTGRAKRAAAKPKASQPDPELQAAQETRQDEPAGANDPWVADFAGATTPAEVSAVLKKWETQISDSGYDSLMDAHDRRLMELSK